MRSSWHTSRFLRLCVVSLSILSLVGISSAAAARKKPVSISGEYNAGPDPKTPMGRMLIDLYAELPEYMAMSDDLMDRQKFRYIFGLMMTRTYFEKNSTKILFIGQDATHIAEAAKQPGTSGFGGRVQSIGRFFGVDEGVSTTNAYLSTINGQYGAFGHIYIESDDSGKPILRQSKYVDNELWAITHSADSEIRISREKFWEWMIVNNPESMGMMAFFGDAARDSFAQFLIGRGFDVPVKMSPERLKRIQVPETILKNAGGNAEFPVPITKKGEDVYGILLEEKYGKKEPYFKKNRWGKVEVNYADAKVQKEAVKVLRESGKRGIDMMVFTGGGIYGSGLTDMGQIAEYDFDHITFKGEKVRSIKGMKLKYFDYVVDRDIAFIESPHPTALSSIERSEGPAKVATILKDAFDPLKELKKRGWYIKPDLDANGNPYENRWDAGKDYRYSKEEIRAGYMEQGAPFNRRTSSADANRLDPQMIIANTRDRAKFDRAKLSAAKRSRPSSPKDPFDLWSVRPRGKESRYVFDRGPGREISEMMATNLDLDALFTPKKGMDEGSVRKTFETHGIDAFRVKSHPNSGYFGTHRGNFETAKALILADPHGVDDWLTSRALTGARGQYLHGLMEDLGFGEDYLVLKTVPFGMDGASREDWEFVRKQTEKYREALIAKALENDKIEILFVDGPVAKEEMERILKKMRISNLTVIDVKRTGLKNPAEGIVAAGQVAKRALRGHRIGAIQGKPSDLPRIHLPWWARTWEGTGGVDLVIDSLGKHRGLGYAIITPDWVAKQNVRLLERTKTSIAKIRAFLTKVGVRIGKEPIETFLESRSEFAKGKWSEIETERRKFFAGEGDTDGPNFFSPEDCLKLLKKAS